MSDESRQANAAFYLGVDGGQSHTKVAVGDSRGAIVGRGTAGPCNHVRSGEGREKLRRAITEAVSEALEPLDCALAETRFAAACFGMSGGPEDKRELLGELLACERMEVTTDAAIALWGGTGGQPGVVVIAGTGSMAFGRNALGKTMRAGGWGYLYGDEGGAFDLTRNALRAALREEEGWGPPTRLRAALLEAGGAADVNDLLHRFYTDEFPRQRVAALAPLVDQIAESGDVVAKQVLLEAGRSLADYGAAVRRQLFEPSEAVQVVQVGGAFNSRFVQEGFRAVLEGSCTGIVAPRFDPAAGALLWAYALAGVDVDLDRFAVSAEQA
ncbi:MAG: BadF/BadG/BcrA/BcrD ATPase family protein [Bryobacterales bacterium]